MANAIIEKKSDLLTAIRFQTRILHDINIYHKHSRVEEKLAPIKREVVRRQAAMRN
jgi:hypothetical protein